MRPLSMSVAAVQVHSLLGFVAAGLLSSAACGQTIFDLSNDEPAPTAEELVEVTLVTEATHLTIGEPLELGVSFRIQPEWHIYWRNSGDTGAPPTISLDLPPGLEAGEVIWPTPTRYVHSGNLVDFIHEHEVTLIIPIHSSGDLEEADEVEIRATIDWLVCKDLCLLGSGEYSIILPVGSPGAHPRLIPSETHAELQRTRERAPRDAKPDDRLRARWEDGSLVLTAAGATHLTFFHAAPEESGPVSVLDDTDARGDTLRVAYPQSIGSAEKVEGVLEVQRENKRSFLTINIEAPQSERRESSHESRRE